MRRNWLKCRATVVLSEATRREIRRKVRRKIWLNEVKISKAEGKISDKLTLMFIELVELLSNRPQYFNYSYKEDMRGRALMQLSSSWHHFNPEKSDNPRAFFVSCIIGSFCYVLNSEHRQRRIKEDLQNMVDDEQHF